VHSAMKNQPLNYKECKAYYSSAYSEIKHHWNPSTNKQNTYGNKENNMNNNNFINSKCQVPSS